MSNNNNNNNTNPNNASSNNNNEMSTSMQSRLLNGNYGHGTPESEFSNFECFQNYTPPEVFVQGLAGIVNQGDVEIIIRAQKQMLRRFEKTNEMLMNCNVLTASRLKIVTEDLKKHTKLISDMRKDLDYIFKKVRNCKNRINTRYPEELRRMSNKTRRSHLSEEADETLMENTAAVEEDEEEATENKVVSDTVSTTSKSLYAIEAAEEKTTSKYSLENTTVKYVQMQHTPEERTNNNGDIIPNSSNNDKNPTIKAPDESTDNESSDCATDTA